MFSPLTESVLVAELALLNNNLPARLCFPLWCDSTSTSHSGEIHDQIVRIPVKEVAVLNSKEKVPFVLQVEVLRSTHFADSSETAESQELKSAAVGAMPLHTYTPTAPPATINSIKHHSSIQRMDESELPARKSLDGPSSDPESPPENEKSAPSFPEVQKKEKSRPADDEVSSLRIASIMLSQLADKEMALGLTEEIQEIKNRIVSALKQYSSLSSPLMTHDDPSALLFQEDWDSRKERVRKESPWGGLPNWDLISVIVKYGDDLRQEQLTGQVITEMKNVWSRDNIPIWVFP